MSLLNQVLIDLEKRGTGVAAGGDAVRAVPSSTNRLWLGLTSLMMVLGAVLLLVALWRMLYHPAPLIAPLPHKIKQHVAAVAPSVPQPESAASAAPLSSFQLSFELSSIPLPRSEPVRHQTTVGKKKAAISPAQHKQQAAAKSRAAPAVEAEGDYTGPPIKHIRPQQQAADEFGQALALIQQGRKSEALPHLETTLQLDPGNAQARQALVGLLLESRRNAEAEHVLQSGLRHNPKQPALAMLLARLQVERGALPQALETLETTLPFADQQANYHAFVAAVLQRQSRNKEAITHYQIALHLAPDTAVWWMGLGISLQAVDADEDARDAFTHAAKLHKLSPELQAFVEKRIKALVPPAK